MNSPIEVRVAAVTQITPVIREFTFEPVRGALPGFSSGSHVVVHMPVGERSVRNAYSLLSNPAQTQHYRIAVRLQDES
ncbi:MAG: oxidoreductase, partial [Pseudomonadaceae bacterium]|nr:oxidoreductase [Pseudomonadaceae bacterium]